jgi:DNA replication regulator SLD3
MNELIEFLEGLILSATVMDRKYKDGVPTILSTLMPDGSMEDGNKPPQKVKKLKSKKSKPSKNGLYPAENAYLCQWWGSYDTDAGRDAPGGSKESVMRKRVAQLRIREMQLQMIVILETLALQSLATSPTDQNGELPSIGQNDDRSDSKMMKGSKSKKTVDLAALIELNIDRLCIWQSLAAEDGRTASKLEGASNIGSKPSTMATTHDHAADILREFCVEVIVPL